MCIRCCLFVFPRPNTSISSFPTPPFHIRYDALLMRARSIDPFLALLGLTSYDPDVFSRIAPSLLAFLAVTRSRTEPMLTPSATPITSAQQQQQQQQQQRDYEQQHQRKGVPMTPSASPSAVLTAKQLHSLKEAVLRVLNLHYPVPGGVDITFKAGMSYDHAKKNSTCGTLIPSCLHVEFLPPYPSSLPSLSSLSTYYSHPGRVLLAAGAIRAALSCFEVSSRVHGSAVPTLLNIALCNAKLGNEEVRLLPLNESFCCHLSTILTSHSCFSLITFLSTPFLVLGIDQGRKAGTPPRAEQSSGMAVGGGPATTTKHSSQQQRDSCGRRTVIIILAKKLRVVSREKDLE